MHSLNNQVFQRSPAGLAVLRRACGVAAAALACLPMLAGPVAARDNKPPHVSFGMAAYITGEGKIAHVEVKKTGPSAVRVWYGSHDCGGSAPRYATPYEDYVPVSGTLQFPKGDATTTILIETIKDKVDGEPTESYTICLKAPTGVAVDLRGQRFTSVVIVDDWDNPSGTRQ